MWICCAFYSFWRAQFLALCYSNFCKSCIIEVFPQISIDRILLTSNIMNPLIWWQAFIITLRYRITMNLYTWAWRTKWTNFTFFEQRSRSIAEPFTTLIALQKRLLSLLIWLIILTIWRWNNIKMRMQNSDHFCPQFIVFRNLSHHFFPSAFSPGRLKLSTTPPSSSSSLSSSKMSISSRIGYYDNYINPK